MFSIKACSLPDNALLNKYRSTSSSETIPAYTDCYCAEITRPVTLAEFVFAFYTTPGFKLERIILRYLAAKPSTDAQVKQLAEASIKSFAAWDVEQRTETQLLMRDFQGRTRSWFMVTPITTSVASDSAKTLLQFGSAVVPRKNRNTGKYELGRDIPCTSRIPQIVLKNFALFSPGAFKKTAPVTSLMDLSIDDS